jgi:hypothetical protein
MISELQTQRTAIDRHIAQEQHTQAITSWEQAKAQAREAKTNVGKLRQVFNESAANWAAYERECEQVRQSLELHLAQHPWRMTFPRQSSSGPGRTSVSGSTSC